jgi:hypothetical protein
MVLRSGVEQPPKVLARSVIAWRNEVGILNSDFGWILRTLKRHLSRCEVLRVWKTLRLRPDEHQSAYWR